MVVMDTSLQSCNTLRGAGPLKSTMDVIWAAQVYQNNFCLAVK